MPAQCYWLQRLPLPVASLLAACARAALGVATLQQQQQQQQQCSARGASVGGSGGRQEGGERSRCTGGVGGGALQLLRGLLALGGVWEPWVWMS